MGPSIKVDRPLNQTRPTTAPHAAHVVEDTTSVDFSAIDPPPFGSFPDCDHNPHYRTVEISPEKSDGDDRPAPLPARGAPFLFS
jgi:hypothetical protein